MKSIATFCASLLMAMASAGITYHVDFSGGDNTADGLTPETAWRHSPGDRNATDHPAAVELGPGDTVLFKGGVAYFGEIEITASGVEGRPITFDANTAGTFGEGRAILDGGALITEWRPVASAAEVQGNPRWRDIRISEIDMDLSDNFNQDRFVPHRDAGAIAQAPWQRILLIDGDRRLLPIAQLPKPSDPFYPDLPGDFFQSPHPIVHDGNNAVVRDEERFVQEDPAHYDGMFIGVHGGNNHVYFARVRAYDPETQGLVLPRFQPRTYPETRYALYNAPRLMERPGEWCVEPLEDGRARIYLLTEYPEEGQPVNIGYPVHRTALSIAPGASHIDIRGFLIQRYAGGAGGVATRRGAARSSHVRISDCEVRFVSGQSGISLNHCDHVVVEDSNIHHCPGWTVGIYVNRVNHFRLSRNRLNKNSGSGIRHYESKQGVLRDNAILDHYGMHASAVNFYEGCADIVFERNHVQNSLTINRNAENILLRNNLIDGQGRATVCVGMWTSGTVGGREFKNIQFLHNTFVNTNPDVSWSTAILGQRRNSPGSPQGLVIRNNILDRISEDLPGVIENNIYTRKVEARFMGPGCKVITDLNALFVDPENGDYRLREGSSAIGAGAPGDVEEDFTGAKRPPDRVDVGAWAFEGEPERP
ncbi:MAG: right-handed parallel beta-helix repeat-containing protein [Kiritimatiellae bacterium]|nr:right-handed parallel beta-helix repeat-containing protein [Kiritimatiellia bacterium]